MMPAPACCWRSVLVERSSQLSEKSFWVSLTWWLGNTRVSATTTFSRRVALKTMISAISSGVRGSTPLKSQKVSFTYLDCNAFTLSAWFHSRIDGIGLGLVAVEPDHGELSLDLAGINLNDADTAGDELLSQALGEAADGGLGGTVDGTTGVRFSAWRGLFR